MKTNQIIPRTIEKNIYLDILEISNIELQKKSWFGLAENHVSSYSELMCRLFDDDQFELFLDKYVLQLDYAIPFRNKLELLKESLNAFNNEEAKTDMEIINDVEWIKISQLAKSIITDWPPARRSALTTPR
jgi:hypothetical protein